MGYAIVGYFDSNSDEKVRALWRGLADLSVDDYLINSDNNPHIKFAMYNSIQLASVKNELLELSKSIKKINIHFKKYGIYPNQKPFLTIDIAENIEIIKLHEKLQRIFSELGREDERGYFVPGIWKPDCQLTISFDKTKLTKAVNYLADTSLPFDGVLEKIGLIEFPPAKQLFSYPLL